MCTSISCCNRGQRALSLQAVKCGDKKNEMPAFLPNYETALCIRREEAW